MSKTIEETLRQAIGDALVRDKTLSFILAKELAHSTEFRAAILENIDYNRVAEVMAQELLIMSNNRNGKGVGRETMLATSLLAQASGKAIELTAQKIAAEVAQV